MIKFSLLIPKKLGKYNGKNVYTKANIKLFLIMCIAGKDAFVVNCLINPKINCHQRYHNKTIYYCNNIIKDLKEKYFDF